MYGLLGICFVIAIKTVPSWKNRLENTKTDFSKLKQKDDINHYSLSMRFEALKTGLKVFDNHQLTGVGEGGLQKSMTEEYNKSNSVLTIENHILPHNQFLQNGCTTGVFSVIFLLLIFILNGIISVRGNNYLLLSFLTIMFFSFQFESFLERQAGITFFILFLLILKANPKNTFPPQVTI